MKKLWTIALLLGLVLVGCGDDEVATGRDPDVAPSAALDETDCSPSLAAAVVESILPTYDYQASESPAALASEVDRVVVGTVEGAGADGGFYWLEIGNAATADGVSVGTVRFGVDQIFSGSPGQFDPTPFIGVRALAFLNESETWPGGFGVSIEGLWFACGDDDVAVPAKLAPIHEGWPDSPIILVLREAASTSR